MGPAVCAAGIRRWEFFIKSSIKDLKTTLENVRRNLDRYGDSNNIPLNQLRAILDATEPSLSALISEEETNNSKFDIEHLKNIEKKLKSEIDAIYKRPFSPLTVGILSAVVVSLIPGIVILTAVLSLPAGFVFSTALLNELIAPSLYFVIASLAFGVYGFFVAKTADETTANQQQEMKKIVEAINTLVLSLEEVEVPDAELSHQTK
jgi:hypothetical protein